MPPTLIDNLLSRAQGGRVRNLAMQVATMGVNGTIQDSAILHAVFLERLKTSEVNSMLSFLNDKVFPDVARTLETRLSRIASRGLDRGPWTTQQYREMLKATDGLLRGGYKEAGVRLQSSLKDIGIYEAKFQRNVLQSIIDEGVGTGMIADITPPSLATLRSIATSKPFEGRFLKEWYEGLGANTQQAVADQVGIGVATGDSTKKIVDRITGTRAANFTDGVMHTSRIHAQTIVRTAVSHIVTQAREMTYKDNKKVIKGVRYLATLDSRTTDVCISLDGQVFGIYEGPRPPMHHQCRSTTVPVIKSWKELGIKLKEAKVGTRASMNGQVPAKMNYGEWLKNQPKRIQNEVLGRKRATLFRRGKVPVSRFVDNRYRSLTLKELEALEAYKIKHGRLPRTTKLAGTVTPKKVVTKKVIRKTVTKKVTRKKTGVRQQATREAVREVTAAEVTGAEVSTANMEGAELRAAMNKKFATKYDEIVDAAERKFRMANQAYDEIIMETMKMKKHVLEQMRLRKTGWKELLDDFNNIQLAKQKEIGRLYRVARDDYRSILKTMQSDMHNFIAIEGEGLSYEINLVPKGTRFQKSGYNKHGTSIDPNNVIGKVRDSRTFLNSIVKQDAAGYRDARTGIKIEHRDLTTGLKTKPDTVGYYQSFVKKDPMAGVRNEGLQDFNMIATKASKNARANASSDGSRLGEWAKKADGTDWSKRNMVCSKADSVEVFVHETGHLIEESNVYWGETIHKFLQSRILKDIKAKGLGTVTDKASFKQLANKALNPINANLETGWRDDFINSYSGRWYSSNATGTEITSMALQHLHENPMMFARRDPELFDLIINLARGNRKAIVNSSWYNDVIFHDLTNLQTFMGNRGW